MVLSYSPLAHRERLFSRSHTDGHEGRLFTPSDADSLAAALREVASLSPEAWQRYSSQARATYLERYTPEVNYGQLMSIYQAAIADPHE